MKKSINMYTALKELIDQPLTAIGRASGMLWLGFGCDVNVKDRNNVIHTVSKYSLHVQCPWKFVNKSILLGSEDMFLPPNGENDDDFDWDQENGNLFDFKKASILNAHQVVKELVFNSDNGSLRLIFNDQTVFEVFPCKSVKDEFWRFIISGDKSTHYVIFYEE